jgi:hypothetical protein
LRWASTSAARCTQAGFLLPVIERHHTDASTTSCAVYSDCERYRYLLRREWADRQRLLFIMLNPSKATELANDPTIERCERRARALGYGGVGIVNLFGWRETSPALLRKAADPIGPENEFIINDALGWADDVLAAWGVHGTFMRRGPDMAKQLVTRKTRLFTLGLTKDGHPRHPLYVAYATPLQRWDAS